MRGSESDASSIPKAKKKTKNKKSLKETLPAGTTVQGSATGTPPWSPSQPQVASILPKNSLILCVV